MGATISLGSTALVVGQGAVASAAEPYLCDYVPAPGEPPNPYVETSSRDGLFISNSGLRTTDRPDDWQEMPALSSGTLPQLDVRDKAYIELLAADGSLFDEAYQSDQVEFWLDDCGQNPRIDRSSNYDFVRGSTTKATGFSLRQLGPGDHLVVARRTHAGLEGDEVTVTWGWFNLEG
ncbi:MAG: hypothetical protein OEW85_15930 [Acidimicrobiia bacterium]|nr:hypothetical protein [Acidimicrobiia bacterium]